MSWEKATRLGELEGAAKGSEFKAVLACVTSYNYREHDTYGPFAVGTVTDGQSTFPFKWGEPPEEDWKQVKGRLLLLTGKMGDYNGQAQLQLSGQEGGAPWAGDEPPWYSAEMKAMLPRAAGGGGGGSRSKGSYGGGGSKPSPTIRVEDLVDTGCWAYGEFAKLKGVSPESAASMSQTVMNQLAYGNIIPRVRSRAEGKDDSIPF